MEWGTPHRCMPANAGVIHVLNMSKTCRSMLRRVRGEEHLLLRQQLPRGNCIDTAICTYSLPLLRRAIPSRSPTPIFIRSYNEDSTLSRHTFGMPEADELKDMTRLLASLWEAAQRLPEGSERQDAFRQIGSFHRRVAALISRAL
jgi:hypothetical protein